MHADDAGAASGRCEHATLATSLVVRETELTLYGFADDDEREVFEALQSAGGVGPRLAQAVLAVHSPDDVRRAVATEDLAALTRCRASGARARSGSSSTSRTGWARPRRRRVGAARRPRGAPSRDEQLHAALVGLGYTAREATRPWPLVAAAAGGAERVRRRRSGCCAARCRCCAG